MLLCAVVFSAGLAAAAGPSLIYTYDPELAVQAPEATNSGDDGPLAIEQKGDTTSFHLETESGISPYLGTGHAPELSADEQRLLQLNGQRGGGPDYHLEAGLGIYIEDRATLNLGYRVHSSPSLIDQGRSDPQSTAGDLRIMFDLKFPFD